MNSFYNNVGARIRKLREINKYTREELSEKADISPKFLYEIETAQKGFSADTLYRIAKALSVNCEYILSGVTQEDYNEELIKALKLFSVTQINDIVHLLELIYKLNTKKT